MAPTYHRHHHSPGWVQIIPPSPAPGTSGATPLAAEAAVAPTPPATMITQAQEEGSKPHYKHHGRKRGKHPQPAAAGNEKGGHGKRLKLEELPSPSPAAQHEATAVPKIPSVAAGRDPGLLWSQDPVTGLWSVRRLR